MRARCHPPEQGFLIPAVHTVLAGWVPPTERARAVSLTTSGMYLGSAAAMLALPSVAAAAGPAALLRLVGGLGLAWLAGWRLTLRSLRRREAATAMPLHGAAGSADGDASGKGHVKHGRPAATPWRAMLLHPAVWAIVINNFTFHVRQGGGADAAELAVGRAADAQQMRSGPAAQRQQQQQQGRTCRRQAAGTIGRPACRLDLLRSTLFMWCSTGRPLTLSGCAAGGMGYGG